ncbi:MAG: MBOAT family protein [Bacteroidota bacterium]
MLFTSFTYAGFLALAFGLYWLLARKGRIWQNALLLLASYGFYAVWDWRFLGLILLSSATDYFAGLRISASNSPSSRKKWLWLSLTVNLGILGLFKYFDFFLGSFQSLMETLGVQANLPTLAFILPVGISFYTFQTLSYTLDVYRGKLDACKDPLRFFTFVAFFPQLVAGPIERASSLLPQLAQVKAFDAKQAGDGLRLILWGLFQKIVLADQLARWVNPIYASPEQVSGPWLLLATGAFALQIYGDFAGYSNIAIGSAKLLGINLMTNFQQPYFATSIRGFWSRWHISLSTWFRDYVYIPLGGNQVSHRRWQGNILLTFLVSGLWHGANWTFVIWGGIHGLAYLVEAASKSWNQIIPKGISWIATLFVVVLAWLFFRAENLGHAWEIIAGFGKGWNQGLRLPAGIEFPTIREGWLLLSSLGLFWLLSALRNQAIYQQWLTGPSGYRWASYWALIAWIAIFGAYEGPEPFIYFQF